MANHGHAGSEGISWIDVSASMAGLIGSLRGAGQQASAGFAQEFQAKVGPAMAAALKGAEAETAAGAATVGQGGGAALAAGFTATAMKELPGGFAKIAELVKAGMGSAGAASAGAAGAAGAGVGAALTGGIGVAVAAGLGTLKADIENIGKFASGEFPTFGKIGRSGAELMMQDFSSVMSAKMPDISKNFDLLEDAAKNGMLLPLNLLSLEIDNTVGRIPLIGSAIADAMDSAKEALGGAFEAFDWFKNMGGDFTQIMVDVGNEWEGAARKIAGQTIDSSGLESTMGILKDIAASGNLANFKDVASAIGELAQRLSGLGGGVGLTREQLEELATVFGEAKELLGGVKINIDNLTGAFNDFNIAPEETADKLTLLVNIARMTGVGFNSLVSDVDKLAPSVAALGYNFDETAFLLGKMNQEMGGPAVGKLAMALAAVEEKFTKKGITDVAGAWRDVISIVQEYIRVGDHAGAVHFAKGFIGAARNAEALVDAIAKNVGGIASGVGAALAASGELLHQPLDDAVEQTRTLSDVLNQVSNQLKASFSEIGMPLVEGLAQASDYIKDWISEHRADIIGFAGEITTEVVRVFAAVATDVGELFMSLAPIVNVFKSVTVGALKALDLAMQAVVKPLSLLPDWLGGDTFKAINKSLVDATGPLNDLERIDLTPMLRGAAEGLTKLGEKAGQAVRPLWELFNQAKDNAALDKAFSLEFIGEGQTDAHYGNAFGSDKDGLKLLGDPYTWDKVGEQLAELGISFEVDASGHVKSFVAQTQKELDALKEFLRSKFGDKTWEVIAPKIPITLAPGKPLTPEELRRLGGLPSEVEIPIVPVPAAPAPAAPPAPAPALPVGPPVDLQPTPIPGHEPQPSLPTHQSGYLVTHPLSDREVLSAAGVPDYLQGALPDSTVTGLLVPTSLNVKDPKQRRTLGQVMDQLGIPSDLQGSDGITVPVNFNATAGLGGAGLPNLSVPGMPGGGGSPLMPSGPLFRNVNWDAIAGFESAGNWSIDHGEGAPGNPVSGGLQIGDATWAEFGGTAFAPRAFMATREQQIAIATKVLAAQGPQAWPVTYANHPDIFGTPGGGMPASVGGAGGVSQVIWDNPRTGSKIGEANGQLVGPGTSQPGYYGNDWADHHGHVHTRFSSGPGGTPYGLPKGTDIRQGAGGFPPWVYQLADLFGLDASTYSGHQEGAGVNQGIDWWPRGHSDMSGLSYTPDELARLQAFAQAMAAAGSGGSAGSMPSLPTTTFTTAGYHTGGNSTGGGSIVGVDYGSGQGGTPAPTKPGSSYADVPPPPGMAPVPDGTPGSIQTPYGSFQYTWNMPAEQQQLLTPEQREKFDSWLSQNERRQQQQASTAYDIAKAQKRLDEAKAAKDAADEALRRKQAEIDKLPPEQRKKAEELDATYKDLRSKAKTAGDALDSAQDALNAAKQRQHDQDVQQHLDAEKPPPWVGGKSNQGKYDSNAETLGKGLVKGIFEELGFPDVFGKPFTEWQLWKTGMGALGFGARLFEQPQTGGASGGSGAAIGGGGNLLDSLIHGLGASAGASSSKTTDTGWNPTATAGTGTYGQYAPQPASIIPAMAQSQPPANMPEIIQAAGVGGTLTVNQQFQGFNPSPQVTDTIREISNTTSAAQLYGGQGLPV